MKAIFPNNRFSSFCECRSAFSDNANQGIQENQSCKSINEQKTKEKKDFIKLSDYFSLRFRLFLLLLIAIPCLFFFHAGHVNQTSRYDAISAFFENTGENTHTFRIDRYLYNDAKTVNTSDWSQYEQHYYSNKSPGTTLFGVIIIAPVRFLENCLIHDATKMLPPAWEIFNAWYLNLWISVLPVTLSVLPLLAIFLYLGFGKMRSVVGAVSSLLATAVFPYSTTLLAHSTVASFLIFSLYFFLRNRKFDAIISGGLLGVAVLLDYSAGVVLIPVGLFLLLYHRKKILPVIIGGLPWAILYCAYNMLCFHSPFSFAANYINPVYHASSFVTIPSFQILAELLIGAKRGILLMMPFFIFAFSGCVRLWKDGGTQRQMAVLISSSAVSLFLMNLMFNGWHGGATTVARYMIPVFPAWSILAFSAPMRTQRIRRLFLLLLCLSSMNMFTIASYTPMTYESDSSPLYQTSYEHLFDTKKPNFLRSPLGLTGTLPNWQKWNSAGSFSLPELMGCGYLASRFILFAGLFLAAIMLLWHFRIAFANAFLVRSGTKTQPSSWIVLACATLFLLCLFPGETSWGIRESAVAFVYKFKDLPLAFQSPWIWLGSCFYHVLSLWSKNIYVLVFLKTLLCASFLWYVYKKISKLLGINAELWFIITMLSPYVFWSMRTLNDISLLLPCTALILWLAVFLFEKIHSKKILLLVNLGIWIFVILLFCFMKELYENILSLLYFPTYYRFADAFYPSLQSTDPQAFLILKFAGWMSVAFWGTTTITGLFSIPRKYLALLPAVIFFVCIGACLCGEFHFSLVSAVPVLALLSLFGCIKLYAAISSLESEVLLQCVKATFVFIVTLCGLVWVMFSSVIKRDMGTISGFGTSLRCQQQLVIQANQSAMRMGIPQTEIRFLTHTKEESSMLVPFSTLHKIHTQNIPYFLAKEQIRQESERPSFLIMRDNGVTKNGALKLRFYYSAPHRKDMR